MLSASVANLRLEAYWCGAPDTSVKVLIGLSLDTIWQAFGWARSLDYEEEESESGLTTNSEFDLATTQRNAWIEEIRLLRSW